MEKVIMSFPGLGIGEFVVNKIAFTIPIFGGLEIRWYGLIITVGMILAVLYAWLRTKEIGVILDDLLDYAIFAILFGVLGARLYYVIMKGGYTSFMEIIAVWNGGLAIYGGVIGGALAVFGVSRYKKMSFGKMADCIIPGVMIAQALGRWGNFFNGEAHGGVVAEGSPLYFLRMGLYPNEITGVSGMAYVHPTFLYESMWNILGFVLINLFYKKKSFDGEVLFWYMAWYGFGRMLIEGLRTDSLMLGPFRVSQVVGLLCFIIGVAVIVTMRVLAYRKRKSESKVDA